MATNDELMAKLYPKGQPVSQQILQNGLAANLEATKANLEQDYNQSNANLNEQKINAQKTADTNLNRTAVEAQKARNNFAETQGAYGLTSGAQAQARLAQNNAEAANMTAIRAQQQETDAQIERQRGLLSDQYKAAIREAQAKNDYELAMALYEAAREKEKRLASVHYGGGGKKEEEDEAAPADAAAGTDTAAPASGDGKAKNIGAYSQFAKTAQQIAETQGVAAAKNWVKTNAVPMNMERQATTVLNNLDKRNKG